MYLDIVLAIVMFACTIIFAINVQGKGRGTAHERPPPVIAGGLSLPKISERGGQIAKVITNSQNIPFLG